MSHYVYIWHKPDGTPFYVGIGKTSTRWNPKRKHTNRNSFCESVLNKYGRENILVHVFGVASFWSACRYERLLIHRIGRSDLGVGTLTNITAGGEGTLDMGEASKEKLRAKWAGNTARKTKLSVQSKSSANVERAIARSKDPNDRFAKNGRAEVLRINADAALTEKRIAALKAAGDRISKGVYASMERRLATMQTPEVQAKLRAPKSEEHRAKLSAAKRKYWADKKNKSIG